MKEEKYELAKPKCTLKDIELKPTLRAEIESILEDRKFSHALEKEGLVPRKLLLLHGPPGCGKTSIAHAIAAETGLPLYLMSGAQVQSMYVGQAEKNMENVFKFAQETECVMLIDEFDSFGRNREKSYNYGVDQVNSLLTVMETRPPKGFVVACTNFHDNIDAAIARRFDVVLEVPSLSHGALLKVAEAVLKGRFGITPEECVAEGKTPSGTVRAAKNKMRQAILEAERKNPTPKPEKEKEMKTAPPIGFTYPYSGGFGESFDYYSRYAREVQREMYDRYRIDHVEVPIQVDVRPSIKRQKGSSENREIIADRAKITFNGKEIGPVLLDEVPR